MEKPNYILGKRISTIIFFAAMTAGTLFLNNNIQIMAADPVVPVSDETEMNAAILAAGTSPVTLQVTGSFDLSTNFIDIPAGANITITSLNTASPATIGRGTMAAAPMIQNKGNLKLENIILDGGAVWSGSGEARVNTGTVAQWQILRTSGTGHVTTLGKNCVIQNNETQQSGVTVYGGGIFAQGGKIVIDGATVKDNLAHPDSAHFSWAGGIYIGSSSSVAGELDFLSGKVSDNWCFDTATDNTEGGNIGTYASASSPNTILRLKGGTISGGFAGMGAGISAYNSDITIEDGMKIENNKGVIAGGAIAMKKPSGQAASRNSLTMTGGDITGNRSEGNDYYGSSYGGFAGAIAINYGTYNITGGTIADNYAKYDGGAMMLAYATGVVGGTTKVTGNVADYWAGGILVSGTSKLTLEGDALIKGNEDHLQGGGISTNSTANEIVLNGGTISDNKSVKGGGVIVSTSSKLSINGPVVIKDNTASSGEGNGIYFRGTSTTIATDDAKVSDDIFLEPGKSVTLAHPLDDSIFQLSTGSSDSANGRVVVVPDGTALTDASPYHENFFHNTKGIIEAGNDLVLGDLYQITYDLKGGKLDNGKTNPIKYTVSTTSFTLNNPAKAGYTFAGWTGTNLSGPNKNVTIAKGSTGDRNYVATWTPRTDMIYRIEYYQKQLDGKYKLAVTETKKDGTTGQTVTAKAKVFKGFTENTNYAGRKISGKIPETGTLLLKIYYDREKYKVTFNSMGGTQIKLQTVLYGDKVKEPSVPVKKGYYFAGWYSDKGYKKKYNFNTAVTGTIVLYAKWTKQPAAKTSILLAKALPKGKTKAKIQWTKVSGATKYRIYWNRCTRKLKKLKTIQGNSKFTWTKSKLKKGQAYKFKVIAYKGNKRLAKSYLVHMIANKTNRKYSTVKSIKAKKSKITLKLKKSKKVGAVVKTYNGKKSLTVRHAKKYRYLSSNKKIATVSKTGKVIGKKKGTCSVYVIGVNGLWTKIKVTVK